MPTSIPLGVTMKKLLASLSLVVISLSTVNYCFADPYQVCFTPGQNCTGLIVSTINKAQKNIDVQAYGFTSQPIINALVSAEKRGVQVRIILDKSNLSGNNSAIPTIEAANIPVWIDYKVKIAHNKVMIIDSETVITGSFNFTSSAQNRNAENVLIVQDPQLAEQYEQNFQNRQSAAVTYNQCLGIYKCSRSKYSSDNG